MRSKPVYTTLDPDLSGRYHLLVGQGCGGNALIRLMAELPGGAETLVLYTTETLLGNDGSGPSAAQDVARFRSVSTIKEALADLDRALAGCFMGTRLYVAGSESFIGSVAQVAANYGLNDDEMRCERCGSAARRVYCIHCNALLENVKTDIVRCTGCGRHLRVRDHYSRRLAAYMGVMADAESPGGLPPIEERFA